jgi:putative DNA primase/helicase
MIQHNASEEKQGMIETQVDEKYNDTFNGIRLAERYGHKIRFVAGAGWYIYDGKRWVRDEKDEIIELASETVRSYYIEAADPDLPDSDRRKLVDWARTSGNMPRLEQMVKRASSRPNIVVTAAELDADPSLLNAQNGTVDLRTGELLEHDPKHLITKIAPVNYVQGAVSELWSGFLDEVFEGDQDIIAFMQRFVGYCLSGDISDPAFLIAHGTGSNAKSTFFNTVQYVMGDYSDSAAANTFLRKDRSGINNDVAGLMGVRFVLTSETAQGERLDLVLVKQVTGGDSIKARFLNKEYFTFKPQMKIAMVTNNKPEIDEAGNAMWRRVHLVPFTASFLGREDPEMPNKLKQAGEAILAWGVQGFMAFMAAGKHLNPPDKVKAATQAYREEQDTLAQFFDDRCTLGPNEKAQSALLYKAYEDWCNDNGVRRLGDKEFANQLQAHGYSKKKSDGKMVWRGISLTGSDAGQGHSVGYTPRGIVRSVGGYNADDDAVNPEDLF